MAAFGDNLSQAMAAGTEWREYAEWLLKTGVTRRVGVKSALPPAGAGCNGCDLGYTSEAAKNDQKKHARTATARGPGH